MDQNKIQGLHGRLAGKNKGFPPLDVFTADMEDPSKREVLSKRMGYDNVADFETTELGMSQKKNIPSSVSDGPPQQPPPGNNTSSGLPFPKINIPNPSERWLKPSTETGQFKSTPVAEAPLKEKPSATPEPSKVNPLLEAANNQGSTSYSKWRSDLLSKAPALANDAQDYDLYGAYSAGLSPTYDPATNRYILPDKDPKTGLLLKLPSHPLMGLTISIEESLGYTVEFRNGRYYSYKPDTSTPVKQNGVQLNELAQNAPAFKVYDEDLQTILEVFPSKGVVRSPAGVEVPKEVYEKHMLPFLASTQLFEAMERSSADLFEPVEAPADQTAEQGNPASSLMPTGNNKGVINEREIAAHEQIRREEARWMDMSAEADPLMNNYLASHSFRYFEDIDPNRGPVGSVEGADLDEFWDGLEKELIWKGLDKNFSIWYVDQQKFKYMDNLVEDIYGDIKSLRAFREVTQEPLQRMRDLARPLSIFPNPVVEGMVSTNMEELTLEYLQFNPKFNFSKADKSYIAQSVYFKHLAEVRTEHENAILAANNLPSREAVERDIAIEFATLSKNIISLYDDIDKNPEITTKEEAEAYLRKQIAIKEAEFGELILNKYGATMSSHSPSGYTLPRIYQEAESRAAEMIQPETDVKGSLDYFLKSSFSGNTVGMALELISGRSLFAMSGYSPTEAEEVMAALGAFAADPVLLMGGGLARTVSKALSPAMLRGMTMRGVSKYSTLKGAEKSVALGWARGELDNLFIGKSLSNAENIFLSAGVSAENATKLSYWAINGRIMTANKFINSAIGGGITLGLYEGVVTGLNEGLGANSWNDVHWGRVINEGLLGGFEKGALVGAISLGGSILTADARAYRAWLLRGVSNEARGLAPMELNAKEILGKVALSPLPLSVKVTAFGAEVGAFVTSSALINGGELTMESLRENAVFLLALKAQHSVTGLAKKFGIGMGFSKPHEGIYNVAFSKPELERLGGYGSKEAMWEGLKANGGEKLLEVLKSKDVPVMVKNKVLWELFGIAPKHRAFAVDNVEVVERDGGYFVEMKSKDALVEERKFDSKAVAEEVAKSVGEWAEFHMNYHKMGVLTTTERMDLFAKYFPKDEVGRKNEELINGALGKLKTDRTGEENAKLEEFMAEVESLGKGREIAGAGDPIQELITAAELDVSQAQEKLDKAVPTLEEPMKKAGLEIKVGDLQHTMPEARQARVAEALGRVLDLDIRFFEGRKGSGAERLKGFYSPTEKNTLYVNVNNKRAVVNVIGHEYTHRLKVSDSDLYTQLEDVVKKYVSTEGQEAYTKLYGKEYTREEITEEFVSDMLGEMFGSKSFWSHVYDKAPQVFNDALSYVKKVVKDLVSQKDLPSSAAVKELEEARKAMADVLAEKFSRQGKPKRNSQEIINEVERLKRDRKLDTDTFTINEIDEVLSEGDRSSLESIKPEERINAATSIAIGDMNTPLAKKLMKGLTEASRETARRIVEFGRRNASVEDLDLSPVTLTTNGVGLASFPRDKSKMSVHNFDEWKKRYMDTASAMGKTKEWIEDQLAWADRSMLIALSKPTAFPVGAMINVKGSSTSPITLKSGKGLRALRPNSDKMYRLSIDMSADCVKRLMFNPAMKELREQVRAAVGRELEDGDILTLIVKMKDKGLSTPCMYCYVESPRRGMQETIGKWITSITNEDFKMFEPANDKPDEIAKSKEKMAIAKKLVEWQKEGLIDMSKLDVPAMLAGAEPTQKIPLPEPLKYGKKKVEYTDLHDLVSMFSSANVKKVDPYEEYFGEIQRFDKSLVDFLNADVGLRWFSSSDLIAEHVPDILQGLSDMALKRIPGHIYTKVENLVRLMSGTNMKINMSLNIHTDKALGIIGTKDSFELEKALEIRRLDKDKHVGTELMATTGWQIEWALNNALIDYIIPYHKSGFRFSAEAGWVDYEKHQKEEWLSVSSVEANRAELAGREKGKKLTPAQMARDGKGFISSASELADGKLGGRKWKVWGPEGPQKGQIPKKYIDNGFIEEVLDKNGKFVKYSINSFKHSYITRVNAKGKEYPALVKEGMSNAEASAKYLDICAELGLKPVFADVRMEDGRSVIEHPEYWKLRKNYARTDTPLLPVETKNIDLKVVDEILTSVVEKKESPLQQKLDSESVTAAVSEAVEFIKSRDGQRISKQDVNTILAAQTAAAGKQKVDDVHVNAMAERYGSETFNELMGNTMSKYVVDNGAVGEGFSDKITEAAKTSIQMLTPEEAQAASKKAKMRSIIEAHIEDFKKKKRTAYELAQIIKEYAYDSYDEEGFKQLIEEVEGTKDPIEAMKRSRVNLVVKGILDVIGVHDKETSEILKYATEGVYLRHAAQSTAIVRAKAFEHHMNLASASVADAIREFGMGNERLSKALGRDILGLAKVTRSDVLTAVSFAIEGLRPRRVGPVKGQRELILKYGKDVLSKEEYADLEADNGKFDINGVRVERDFDYDTDIEGDMATVITVSYTHGYIPPGNPEAGLIGKRDRTRPAKPSRQINMQEGRASLIGEPMGGVYEIKLKVPSKDVVFDVEGKRKKLNDELGAAARVFTAVKASGNTAFGQIVEAAKKHADDRWNFLQKRLELLSEDQIMDYITHLWDLDKGDAVYVRNQFMTNNELLKKRTLETLMYGIEARNMIPKSLDASKLIKYADILSYTVEANRTFVDYIRKMNELGFDIIRPAGQEPKGQYWRSIKHPALERLVYYRNEDGKKVVKRSGHWVYHPALTRIMESQFGEVTKLGSRGAQGIFNAYDTLGGIVKKTMLSISLFHHLALSETVIPMNGLSAPKVFYKVIRDIYNGEEPAWTNELLTLDAAAHGLQLGATKDYPAQKIQEFLDKTLLTKYTVGVFNAKWDRVLWDYLHDGYKIYAYESAVENYMRRNAKGQTPPWKAKPKEATGTPERVTEMPENMPVGELRGREEVQKYTPERGLEKYVPEAAQEQEVPPISITPFRTPDPLTMAKREIARMINDTYGGQSWDLLLIPPDSQKWGTRTFLSLDWTFSTMRQGLSILGLGAAYSPVQRAKMGIRYWATVGTVYYMGLNFLNSFLRRQDMEENPELYRYAMLGGGFYNIEYENGKGYLKVKDTGPNGEYYGDTRAELFQGSDGRWYVRHTVKGIPDTVEEVDVRGDLQSIMQLPWHEQQMLLGFPGNVPHHKTHLFMGRWDDGTERYARWGKPYREWPELFIDREGFSVGKPFMTKLGAKLNPLLNMGAGIFTGHTASGFEIKELHGKEGWGWTEATMRYMLSIAEPLSIKQTIENQQKANGFNPWVLFVDLTMPSSKGMTGYAGEKEMTVKLQEYYDWVGENYSNILATEIIEQLETGVDERMLDGVIEIYMSAIRNKQDAAAILKGANQNVLIALTKSYSEKLTEISEVRAKLQIETNPIKREKLEVYLKELEQDSMPYVPAINELNGLIYKIRSSAAKRFESGPPLIQSGDVEAEDPAPPDIP